MGRQIGEIKKIAIESAFGTLRSTEGVGVVLVDELGEPNFTGEQDPDYDPDIDQWLIDYERGFNGERAEGEQLPSQPGLEVDIDDGRPDSPTSRLGSVLRRTPVASGNFKKFNRSNGNWE